MYKEIVEILKCPCCGTDLELITEKEENGEIIERGTHEDLLKQKGKYYQLYTGMFELE